MRPKSKRSRTLDTLLYSTIAIVATVALAAILGTSPWIIVLLVILMVIGIAGASINGLSGNP